MHSASVAHAAGPWSSLRKPAVSSDRKRPRQAQSHDGMHGGVFLHLHTSTHVLVSTAVCKLGFHTDVRVSFVRHACDMTWLSLLAKCCIDDHDDDDHDDDEEDDDDDEEEERDDEDEGED